MNNKQLRKSTTDKKVAGVAGGIAAYFEVDPTLVRLAFVLFTLMGGPGLLVYIILAIVLPSEDGEAIFNFEQEKRKNDFAA